MMKKGSVWLLLLSLGLVAGCDMFSSEPSYGGLSISGFNYTPYNLSRFTITDNYKNKASGGGDLMPGSGQGRLSCCYKLKGTEFTVTWDVYDADEAIKDLYAPIKMLHKTTKVHMPPTNVPGGMGERVLGLHFYPDDHVEMEIRRDLRGTRIFYRQVDAWLFEKQGKSFEGTAEDWKAFRRTARTAAEGWIKYRLTDTEDLQQYVYYTLLVNPKFDEHPAVRRILEDAKGEPGAFAVAMEALPVAVFEELKQGKVEPIKKGGEHG